MSAGGPGDSAGAARWPPWHGRVTAASPFRAGQLPSESPRERLQKVNCFCCLLTVILSNFIPGLGSLGAEEELLCKLPLCVSHTRLSIPHLPVQQISTEKRVQMGGGVEVGPRKQRRKRDGLITAGEKEMNAHLQCANHYNLAQNEGSKGCGNFCLLVCF